MGAPEGNQNAAKSRRLFSSALKRLFAQQPEKADALALKLLEWAEGGEQWAFKELLDRLDGKVAQALIGGDEDDPDIKLITRVERILVRANPPDTNGPDI
jgi:hypothetical protein